MNILSYITEIKNKTPKNVLITIIALVFLGFAWKSCSSSPKITYETAHMEKGDVASEIAVVGSVVPQQEIKLSFQVPGKVKKVMVEDGAKVDKGQELILLDDVEYVEQVKKDEAALQNADAQQKKVLQGLRKEERNVLEVGIATIQKNLVQAKDTLLSTKNVAYADVRQAELAFQNAVAVYEATKKSNERVNTEEVKSAQTIVNNARLSLDATAKSNIESIAAAQSKVNEAQIALQNAKKNVTTGTPIQEQNLTKAQEDAFYSAVNYLNEVDRTLRAANEVYTIEDYNKDFNAAYKAQLGIKKYNSYNDAVEKYGILKMEYSKNKDLFVITNRTLSYEEIVRRLQIVKGILDLAFDLSNVTFELLVNSTVSNLFPQATLDAQKNAMLAQKEKVTAALSGIATVIKTVESLQLQKSSTLTSLQNTVDSATEALRSAEKNLDSVRAQTDEKIISAKNNVKQSEDNLAKIMANTSNKDITLLTAYNAMLTAERALDGARAKAQNQIQTAENSLVSTESQLSQNKTDYTSKTAPARDSDVSIQDAAYKQANALLALSKTKLEYTKLKAPMAGVITAVDTKEGEQVNTTMVVIRMIGDAPDTVEANVSETDISRVLVGQKVLLDFDAFDKSIVYDGITAKIASDKTALDGVIYYKTKVEFAQSQFPENLVRPGMTANLRFIIEGAKNVYRIPKSAVKEEENDGKTIYYVQIVTDEKNQIEEKKIVDIGIRGDSYIEIIGGLEETDAVIIMKKTNGK